MSDLCPKDEVAAEDEKTTLLAFLGHQRNFLIHKASGLSEQQIRIASCPPSDLTLLGLVVGPALAAASLGMLRGYRADLVAKRAE